MWMWRCIKNQQDLLLNYFEAWVLIKIPSLKTDVNATCWLEWDAEEFTDIVMNLWDVREFMRREWTENGLTSRAWLRWSQTQALRHKTQLSRPPLHHNKCKLQWIHKNRNFGTEDIEPVQHASYDRLKHDLGPSQESILYHVICQ